MQDDHGKKSPETGALPGADDAANAPVKPTVLSDDELDGVAGGFTGGTISVIGLRSGTVTAGPLGGAPAFTVGPSKP
jgi:hypothetical protein